jgi:hypothetical protein
MSRLVIARDSLFNPCCCGWRRTIELERAGAAVPPSSFGVATLGELHRPPGWVWVYCTRYAPLCQHRAPMALAPLVIRWGRGVSSDKLRRCARCTVCGHKGATLQHPGWKNGHVEREPFPVDKAPSGHQELLFD